MAEEGLPAEPGAGAQASGNGIDRGRRLDDTQADGRSIIRHGEHSADRARIAPGIWRQPLANAQHECKACADAKKVRLTEVAGPVDQLRLSAPKAGHISLNSFMFSRCFQVGP